MKVLLVPGTGVTPGSGGQGSFCKYVAEGLIELGHSVELNAGQEWSAFCKQWSISLRNGDGSPAGPVDVVHLNGLGIRRAIRETLRGSRLIFTHQDYRYMCPSFIAWTPNGCVGDGLRGPCQYCPNRGLWSRTSLGIRRLIAGRSSNVAVSRCVLRRLALPNGSVIFNPARVEPASSSQDQRLLAFAGRLVPEKGVQVLLEAVSKLDHVRLEIAGDGPMLPWLRQLAIDLRIESRVRFLGQVPLENVLDLYRRAAAVCVPSIWHDPCPLAAIEAMAIGRALVTSDRGGLPELAGDERGWVCHAEDADEWAETIRTALADTEERSRRCRRATDFVAGGLSPRHIAQQYVDVYTKALGGTMAGTGTVEG